MVAILAKDGNYDLEKGNNNGDAGDMWLPGDFLGPGMGGIVYPNTDTYQVRLWCFCLLYFFEILFD